MDQHTKGEKLVWYSRPLLGFVRRFGSPTRILTNAATVCVSALQCNPFFPAFSKLAGGDQTRFGRVLRGMRMAARAYNEVITGWRVAIVN